MNEVKWENAMLLYPASRVDDSATGCFVMMTLDKLEDTHCDA